MLNTRVSDLSPQTWKRIISASRVAAAVSEDEHRTDSEHEESVRISPTLLTQLSTAYNGHLDGNSSGGGGRGGSGGLWCGLHDHTSR